MEALFNNGEPTVNATRLSELRAQHGKKAGAYTPALERKISRRQFNGYTAFDRKCALMLNPASGHATDPAISYLKHSGVSGRPLGSSLWPDKALSRVIDYRFMDTSLDVIADLQEECVASISKAGKRASRVLKAHQLLKWERQLNLESGIAPSTHDLGTKFDDISSTAALDVLEWELQHRAVLSQNRNRCFLKKFRKSWVIKTGKIRATSRAGC